MWTKQIPPVLRLPRSRKWHIVTFKWIKPVFLCMKRLCVLLNLRLVGCSGCLKRPRPSRTCGLMPDSSPLWEHESPYMYRWIHTTQVWRHPAGLDSRPSLTAGTEMRPFTGCSPLSRPTQEHLCVFVCVCVCVSVCVRTTRSSCCVFWDEWLIRCDEEIAAAIYFYSENWCLI